MPRATPLRHRWTALVKSALVAAVALGTLSAGQAQALTYTLRTSFSFGGKAYRVYNADQNITWAQARTQAQSLGTYDLVSINSAAENAAIFGQLTAADWTFNPPSGVNFGPWIGLQINTWVDGTTIASNGYSGYASGQPSGGSESFGHYFGVINALQRDQWNDADDTNINVTVRSFVAEDTPGPLPLLGIAAVFGFSRKLRKRIKNSANPGSSSSTI